MEGMRVAYALPGFAGGGRITWLYAAHNPHLKAAVAWYGRLVGDTSETTPAHPLDVANQLHAPVLGLYGGADNGIPLETIERMKNALAADSSALQAQRTASARSEFVVHPDAPHALFADYRPGYRKAAAEDAWLRCIQWFRANGAA
jgi:carboxymethylenebutenolidase